MNNVQIIDGKNSSFIWNQTLNLLPRKSFDIYYTWEYLNLYEEENRSEALLFKYQSAEKIFISPFLFHTISSINGNLLDTPIFDIETAYGYGGPVSTSLNPSFLQDANEAFSNWCREIGVTAEFIRFHPILSTEKFSGKNVKIEFNRTTYSILINQLKDPIDHFHGPARNKIRKALKSGLNARELEKVYGIEQFLSLYTETLERVGANKYYNFSKKYFEKLSKFPSDKIRIIGVEDNFGMEAIAIFLADQNGFHYHLSASRSHRKYKGVTNLLLYTAVEMAIKDKKLFIHLGGGLSSEGSDSLSVFKKSVSNKSHQYFIGKRTHRPEVWNSANILLSDNNLESHFPKKFFAYHDFP
jgi:hypothetical protein